MSFTYEYARPMVTSDVVLFSPLKGKVFILLIERMNEPFAGCWALPGGFVEENEDLVSAAARELKEETNIEGVHLKQLFTFGKPGRDPRGHCITVAYWGIVDHTKIEAKAGDDAKNLQWFNIEELPKLAFDHDEIIAKAIKKAGY